MCRSDGYGVRRLINIRSRCLRAFTQGNGHSFTRKLVSAQMSCILFAKPAFTLLTASA
jgi:hypothetical protein